MIALDTLAHKAAAISKLLETEAEILPDSLRIKKERIAAVRKSTDFRVSLSLSLYVSFRATENERETFNTAEVFLLPDELPFFTKAFIQHAILLPINYSQQLTMEHGIHCILLNSQELPENFAIRLSDALSALK